MFAPLSTQVQTAQDAIRSALLRVHPFRNAPGLSLAVEGGLHDRCTTVLRLDRISVGSDGDNDLMLLDPVVAGHHLCISVYNSLLGPLATVTARDGPLEVNGQAVAAGSQSRHLRLPLGISLGEGVAIRVSSLTPRRRQASVLERLFRRIATTAAVLVAATVGLVLWHPSSGQVVVVPPDEPAATAQATGGGAGVTVAAFREKLAELKLGDAVDVRENADGFLVVQGRLTSAQMRSWKKVSVWYDGVASSRPLLTSFTNAADLPEMPPIALVRLSEPKAIILRSGEVLTRRARFSGNWQVADIQRDHIVISRGKHREVLRFAGQAK